MSCEIAAYCLNTSSIRNCGLGLQEKIELVARVGYGAIELWIDEIETYLTKEGTLSELRAILNQNAINVPNLIAFFNWAIPDAQQREKALKEAINVFEIAQTLACPYVAAPPAGIGDREDIPPVDLAGYYQDLLEATQKTNVKPLLEFWGHSKTLGSLRETMEVLNILGNPEVRLLGDVFHMAKTEDSLELLGKLDGTQAGLFHINDYPNAPDIRQLTDDQRLYPGDGVAPLQKIIDTLKRIGYTGMYSLELFNEKYEEAGAMHVAETGLAKMKQLLE